MAVKILHASDFHMDSPYKSLPEDKARERRREGRELFERLSMFVESENVDIVLLPGDLFDSSASYWETTETITRVLSCIKAQVFIAPGNHDFYSPRSPYAYMELPDNVHIFRSSNITYVEIPELNVRVYGAGFTTPVCSPLLNSFHAIRDDMINLMVMHGDLVGDRYNHISQEAIINSGLDYLALGHVHSYSGILSAGNTSYAYCGCLEGRGFDETGAKGVIAGTVERGKCDLRFIPMGGRRYETLNIDLTDSDDAYASILSAVGEGRPNDIVRIVLSGEYSDRIETENILSAVNDKYYHVTIKDNTRMRRGIWDGIDDDTLTGLFLSRLKEQYDSADEKGQEEILLAARYGIAALEGREEWRP